MSSLQYMEETWVGYDDMGAPVTLLFRPSLIIVGCLRKHFSWYLAHVKQRGSLALSFWTSGRWCSSWNLKVYGRADERAEAHCHQSRPSAQRGQISSTRQTYVRLSQTMKSVCESWETVPNGFADYMLRVAQHIKIQI